MSANSEFRTYRREEAVVFLKTKEQWGGLSNMAGGYPLEVNGVRIRTSEALYQACRFPNASDVQQIIIEQASPMAAKMMNKPFRATKSRPDWEEVRVNVMRWCLRAKLAQNWHSFGYLLRETGKLPIVEESRRDTFWGAKPVDVDMLLGQNILGRLLMELREQFNDSNSEQLRMVQPLSIPDFLLFDEPIGTVAETDRMRLERETAIKQLNHHLQLKLDTRALPETNEHEKRS